MDNLYKYRRLIVVALALILIGVGVFQGITGITFNSEALKTIEYVVMFGALYLLLILPKQHAKKEHAEHEQQSGNKQEDSDASLPAEENTTHTIDDTEKQNKTED